MSDDVYRYDDPILLEPEDAALVFRRDGKIQCIFSSNKGPRDEIDTASGMWWAVVLMQALNDEELLNELFDRAHARISEIVEQDQKEGDND